MRNAINSLLHTNTVCRWLIILLVFTSAAGFLLKYVAPFLSDLIMEEHIGGIKTFAFLFMMSIIWVDCGILFQDIASILSLILVMLFLTNNCGQR